MKDVTDRIYDELARISRTYGDVPPACILLGASELDEVVNSRETDKRFQFEKYTQLSFVYRDWILPIYGVPLQSFFSLGWYENARKAAYHQEVRRDK